MVRGVFMAIVLLGCGGEPAAIAGSESSSGGGSSETGDIVIAGPRIERSTASSVPGGSVFVQTDEPIAEVELRVDGVRLPEPPIVAAGGAGDRYGGLFALPAELGVGEYALAVRSRGGAADSHQVALAIVTPSFVDVAAATGLLQVHDVSGHPEGCAWSSTGLGFADIDGDGDSDFYVGNVGRAGRMMRNDGDQDGDGLPDFTEVTEALGLAGIDNVSAVSFVDHDNDGDRDLLVGRRGANVLLNNEWIETGAPGFVDITASAGLGADAQRTMGAAWGDYDGDGDLDLYVVNHAWCFPREGSELRAQDHLYRNDDGAFVEVSAQLDVSADSPLHSLGFSAVWIDHDRDGDQDLIVINDHIAGLGGANALWRNDGPGDAPGAWRFTSVGAAAGVAIAADSSGEGANGMGLAVGDVDRDGFPDLAFSNIGPNYLLLNNGDGSFRDASAATGMRRGLLAWQRRSITWAVHLFDHDNDADLDLYFAGGPIHDDEPIPDALLRNEGAMFVDVTWEAGLQELGSGKGSALVDLDGDGWLDLATAHWARPLRVYHNRRPGPAHHWLGVDLVGTSSNRDALGSVVVLATADGPARPAFTPRARRSGPAASSAVTSGSGRRRRSRS
ncbi:VCBS repeat-containing protein [Nannocystis sp.]|uniref:FG-GAP repeat domain-containing protein n=1 Tax=Nannocystis sp. TaxID=1962667 RepID=UPI0025E7107F|nr:VCBS repeat-containing protein [Nannocystis sp.]MBK7827703.1 VCBS repeat-containing protein [Nannocystis sp.]